MPFRIGGVRRNAPEASCARSTWAGYCKRGEADAWTESGRPHHQTIESETSLYSTPCSMWLGLVGVGVTLAPAVNAAQQPVERTFKPQRLQPYLQWGGQFDARRRPSHKGRKQLQTKTTVFFNGALCFFFVMHMLWAFSLSPTTLVIWFSFVCTACTRAGSGRHVCHVSRPTIVNS